MDLQQGTSGRCNNMTDLLFKVALSAKSSTNVIVGSNEVKKHSTIQVNSSHLKKILNK